LERLAVALAEIADGAESGRCIPVTVAKSNRSSQPRAIRRDEYTPWL
jgi:hypothetical protein